MDHNFVGTKRSHERITAIPGIQAFARATDTTDRITDTTLIKNQTPITTTLGRPSWILDQTSSYLQLATLNTQTTEATIAFVVTQQPTDAGALLGISTPTENTNVTYSPGQLVLQDESKVLDTNTLTQTLLLFRFTTRNTGDVEYWKNGTHLATHNVPNLTLNSTTIRLGAMATNTPTLAATGLHIAAYACWSRALTPTECASLSIELLAGPLHPVLKLNPKLFFVTGDTRDRTDGTPITIDGDIGVTVSTRTGFPLLDFSQPGTHLELEKAPLLTNSQNWTVCMAVHQLPTNTQSLLFTQGLTSPDTNTHHGINFYPQFSVSESPGSLDETKFNTMTPTPTETLVTLVHTNLNGGEISLYVGDTLQQGPLAHTESYVGPTPTHTYVHKSANSDLQLYGLAAFDYALTATEIKQIHNLQSFLGPLDTPQFWHHQPYHVPITQFSGLTANSTEAPFSTLNTVANNGLVLSKQEQWCGKHVFVPGYDSPSAIPSTEINNDNWSGTELAIANGGTGASDAPTARINLGVAATSHTHTATDVTDLGTLATLSSVNNANWSGTALAITNGGTGATDATTALANLGAATTFHTHTATDVTDLGTLATLSSVNNSNWSGTDLAIEHGGTGASDAPTALINLGAAATSHTHVAANITDLGTLATQSSVNNTNWSGTDLAIEHGGTGASDAATARTNLGVAATVHTHTATDVTDLGTLATLSSVNNSNWSGTALAVANGGTGASDAATARTNLGVAATVHTHTATDVTDLGTLATLSSVNNTNWSGTALAVANGGTGASDAPTALINLGAAATSHTHTATDVTDLGILATLSSVNNANWSGTALTIANGGTGATDAGTARTNLGVAATSHTHTATDVTDLGALATLSSVSNANWSGTDLAIEHGGTGASDAATARTNLGVAATSHTHTAANITDLGTLATLSSVNNTNWSGTALTVANGGTGATDAATARTNLGVAATSHTHTAANVTDLGALATLSSINNANWSGTDLAVANGGTGASDATTARTNLSSAAITHTHLITDLLDLNTVSIATAANSGLTGGGNITATRNLAVDIAGTTAETTAAADDLVLVWDTSASALRHMTRENFVGSSSGSGVQALTTVERLAIVSPTQGQQVYDTDQTILYTFSQNQWRQVLNNDIGTIASSEVLHTIPNLEFFAKAADPADRISQTTLTTNNVTKGMTQGRPSWSMTATSSYMQCAEGHTATTETTIALLLTGFPTASGSIFGLTTASAAVAFYFGYHQPSNQFEVSYDSSDTILKLLVPQPNEILDNHVIVCRFSDQDGGQVQVFVDGTQVTQTAIEAVALTTTNLRLGSVGAFSAAVGTKVAATALWSRALSPLEITKITKDALGGMLYPAASLNPKLHIVAGEPTDRTDGTTVSQVGGLTTAKSTRTGLVYYNMDTVGKYLELVKVPIPQASKDWSVCLAVEQLPATTSPVHRASLFIQINTGSNSTNHYVNFSSTDNTIEVDEWEPSGGGIVSTALTPLPTDTTLTIVHSSENSGQVTIYRGGAWFQGPTPHTETYSGVTPNRTRINYRTTTTPDSGATFRLYGLAVFDYALTADQAATLNTIESVVASADTPNTRIHEPSYGPVMRYTGTTSNRTNTTFSTLQTVPENGVVLYQKQQWNDQEVFVAGFDEPPEATTSVAVGTITAYAGTDPPEDWLMCDGSSVSRLSYPDLFAVIGTTYGSEDGTTFKLPDLRNRFLAGAGDTYTIAEQGGADEVTLTEAQIPSHRHIAGNSANATNLTGHRVCNVHGDQNYYNFNDTGNLAWSSYTGGGQSHENRPPFMAVNYIIRYRSVKSWVVKNNPTATPDILVYARYVGADVKVNANVGQIMVWNTISTDLTGAHNPTTGVFTAPETAHYEVHAHFSSASSGSNGPTIHIRINSTSVASSFQNQYTGTLMVPGSVHWSGLVTKGQTIDIYFQSWSNDAYFRGSTGNHNSHATNGFSVKKVGAPAVTAHSVPQVLVHATRTTASNITSDATIVFNNKHVDVGNHYSAADGFFRPTSPGYYKFYAYGLVDTPASNASTLVIRKNTTPVFFGQAYGTTGSGGKMHVEVTGVLLLSVGETADIYFDYGSAFFRQDPNGLTIEMMGAPPTVIAPALTGTEAGIPVPNVVKRWNVRSDGATGWTGGTNNSNVEYRIVTQNSSMSYTYSAAVGRRYRFVITFSNTTDRGIASVYVNDVFDQTFDTYTSNAIYSPWTYTTGWYMATSTSVKLTLTNPATSASGYIVSVCVLHVEELQPLTDVSSGLITTLPTPEVLVHGYLANDMGPYNANVGAIIKFTPLTDLGNHYNQTTGLFTCPFTGYYRVAATGFFQKTSDFIIRKNSGGTNTAADGQGLHTSTNTGNASMSVEWTGLLEVGNTIDFFFQSRDATTHMYAGIDQPHRDTGINSFSIEKIGAPAVTAHTEPQCAVSAIKNDTNVTSSQVVVFNVKHIDRGNHYNPTTGVFTAESTGIYRICAWGKTAQFSGVLDGNLIIRHNGVDTAYNARAHGDVSGNSNLSVEGLLDMNAGDTADIYYTFETGLFYAANNGLIITKVGEPPTVTAAGTPFSWASFRATAGQVIGASSHIAVNMWEMFGQSLDGPFELISNTYIQVKPAAVGRYELNAIFTFQENSNTGYLAVYFGDGTNTLIEAVGGIVNTTTHAVVPLHGVVDLVAGVDYRFVTYSGAATDLQGVYPFRVCRATFRKLDVAPVIVAPTIVTTGVEQGIPVPNVVERWSANYEGTSGWTTSSGSLVNNYNGIYSNSNTVGVWIQYTYDKAKVGRRYRIRFICGLQPHHGIGNVHFNDVFQFSVNLVGSTNALDKSFITDWQIATSSTIHIRLTATGSNAGGFYMNVSQIEIEELTPLTDVSAGLVTTLPTPDVMVQGHLLADMGPYSTYASTNLNFVAETNIGGHYNGTTGLFTCPSTGHYRVAGFIRVTGDCDLVIRKNSGGGTAVANGTGLKSANSAGSGSPHVEWQGLLQKDDTIDFAFTSWSTVTILAGYQNHPHRDGGLSSFSIQRVGAPAVTAHSEPQCLVEAERTAGNVNTTGVLIFNHKTIDANSNYNPSTGTFTAPTTGKYHVTAYGLARCNTGGENQAWADLQIRKNGVVVKSGHGDHDAQSGSYYANISVSSAVDLQSGDTLDIYLTFTSGQYFLASGTPGLTYNGLTITKIGEPPTVTASGDPLSWAQYEVVETVTGLGSEAEKTVDVWNLVNQSLDAPFILSNRTHFQVTSAAAGRYEISANIECIDTVANRFVHIRMYESTTVVLDTLSSIPTDTGNIYTTIPFHGSLELKSGLNYSYTFASESAADLRRARLLFRRLDISPIIVAPTIVTSGVEQGIPVPTIVKRWNARSDGATGWTGATFSSDEARITTQNSTMTYTYSGATPGRRYRFIITFVPHTDRAISTVSIDGVLDHTFDLYQPNSAYTSPIVSVTGWCMATSSSVWLKFTNPTHNINSGGYVIPVTILQVEELTPLTDVSAGLVTTLPTPDVLVHGYLANDIGPYNTDSGAIVKFTASTDLGTHYNPTTGLFTCPTTGYYRVAASGFMRYVTDLVIRKNSGGTNTAADGEGLQTTSTPGNANLQVEWSGLLEVGNTIDFFFQSRFNDNYMFGGYGPTYRDTGLNYFSIQKIGAPAVTAHSMPACLVYAKRTSGDINTNADTIVIFNDKTTDLGNDFYAGTGQFVAPSTAYYSINSKASIWCASSSSVVVRLRKNAGGTNLGTDGTELDSFKSDATNLEVSMLSWKGLLQAGDTVDVHLDVLAGSVYYMAGTGNNGHWNFFSVEQLGAPPTITTAGDSLSWAYMRTSATISAASANTGYIITTLQIAEQSADSPFTIDTSGVFRVNAKSQGRYELNGTLHFSPISATYANYFLVENGTTNLLTSQGALTNQHNQVVLTGTANLKAGCSYTLRIESATNSTSLFQNANVLAANATFRKLDVAPIVVAPPTPPEILLQYKHNLGNTNISSSTVIPWNTTITAVGTTLSNGVFTCPASGYYKCTYTMTSIGSGNCAFQIRKNTVPVALTFAGQSAAWKSSTVEWEGLLSKGETLDTYIYIANIIEVNCRTDDPNLLPVAPNNLIIRSVSSGPAITAHSIPACAVQAVSTAGNRSVSGIIPFNLKSVDMGGNYSAGGIFTAPNTGLYKIHAYGIMRTDTKKNSSLLIRKNTTPVASAHVNAITQEWSNISLQALVEMNRGDTADIYLEYGTAYFFAGNSGVSIAYNGLTIEQVNAPSTTTTTGIKVVTIKDVKPNNIPGGTPTGSNAWYTRVLNTLDDPLVAGVKLDTTTSEFTVLPGSYTIQVAMPFLLVDSCQARLVNVSANNTVLAYGMSQYMQRATTIHHNGLSHIYWTGTFATTTILRTEYNVAYSDANNRLGIQAGRSGAEEVYTQVLITQFNINYVSDSSVPGVVTPLQTAVTIKMPQQVYIWRNQMAGLVNPGGGNNTTEAHSAGAINSYIEYPYTQAVAGQAYRFIIYHRGGTNRGIVSHSVDGRPHETQPLDTYNGTANTYVYRTKFYKATSGTITLRMDSLAKSASNVTGEYYICITQITVETLADETEYVVN